MTTNKPKVVAWGTFYRGVMQDFAYNRDGAERSVKLDFHQRPLSIEPLIRLSDYEALQAECDGLRKDLEEAEARGAELSAGACHGGYGDDYGNHRCHYQNRIDHLSAMLRHAQPIIRAHAGASHMLDGFRPKRNQWDELVDAVDAAIQEDRQ